MLYGFNITELKWGCSLFSDDDGTNLRNKAWEKHPAISAHTLYVYFCPPDVSLQIHSGGFITVPIRDLRYIIILMLHLAWEQWHLPNDHSNLKYSQEAPLTAVPLQLMVFDFAVFLHSGESKLHRCAYMYSYWKSFYFAVIGKIQCRVLLHTWHQVSSAPEGTSSCPKRHVFIGRVYLGEHCAFIIPLSKNGKKKKNVYRVDKPPANDSPWPGSQSSSGNLNLA